MTEEEAKQLDQQRWAAALALREDPDKLREWLVYTADMLRRSVLYVGPDQPRPQADEYERNAALIAIQALDWLAKPPETVRIVAKRQPLVIADGQGGTIHIGDWPKE